MRSRISPNARARSITATPTAPAATTTFRTLTASTAYKQRQKRKPKQKQRPVASMQGRHRWSVAAVALVASVALAASFPPAAGLPTRTGLRLPWKSPLGPLGKLHHRPTATNVTTGPVPTYARPPHKQQQQQQPQQLQQRKPVAPKGPGATEPARGPGTVAYDRAPTARQPATNATVTPRPAGLESTTHDRAIIMAPLKRCPEGQRMGPDRNCRPNYTDPEDEAD